MIADCRFAIAESPCLARAACCVKGASTQQVARGLRRGVGLIELLIALAITAGLLTAAAIGIDASFKAYSINQTQSDTLQRARLCLHRLTTYIRTSSAHSPIDDARADSFAHGSVVTDTGIALFDENDNELTFRYDAPNQQLIVRENNTDHVLLRGVTAFSVRMTPMRSVTSIKTGGGFDVLRQATITLTVRFSDDASDTQGDEASRTITLSTSSTPRVAL